jgi:hypothetical protein
MNVTCNWFERCLSLGITNVASGASTNRISGSALKWTSRFGSASKKGSASLHCLKYAQPFLLFVPVASFAGSVQIRNGFSGSAWGLPKSSGYGAASQEVRNPLLEQIFKTLS